ncbi:aspartate/glutamate racemase family protein [Ornithinimicrobium pekingense]|uniref:Aspartate racemase n=1 Tax=Ornithinimicrobium pekingense TaxID=384677 RepID=A0ABQ2FC87_9MICO|nr:amino acid racemase [Ornithinimicrobium pekingense]GGK78011.1 aspartate racemase [Ornithinimicrobium pekingense]
MTADGTSTDGRLLPGTWDRPVLGVLGGMGPAATVAFLDALVRATPAATDQEHIDTVVLSHAGVPDRTRRLLDPEQPDPTPYLMGDLEVLARLGASCAVIACNTSHAFLPEELPLPLLSLVRVGAQAAVARARESGSQQPRVMVLATDGTRLSGVYQEALADLGARSLLPDEAGQREVMSVIYDGVKAGLPVSTPDFLDLVARLRGEADTVLLACTELSVLAEQAGPELPGYAVDAQAALVARVVSDLT